LAEPAARAGLDPFLAERLAAHQLPVAVYQLTEIPRTSRGKVNRDHVAKACLKN